MNAYEWLLWILSMPVRWIDHLPKVVDTNFVPVVDN